MEPRTAGHLRLATVIGRLMLRAAASTSPPTGGAVEAASFSGSGLPAPPCDLHQARGEEPPPDPLRRVSDLS
jgi:hypothetical protein